MSSSGSDEAAQQNIIALASPVLFCHRSDPDFVTPDAPVAGVHRGGKKRYCEHKYPSVESSLRKPVKLDIGIYLRWQPICPTMILLSF